VKPSRRRDAGSDGSAKSETWRSSIGPSCNRTLCLRYDLMPALAAELVRRQVAVIVAVGGVPPGLAAKAATSIIPIVFIIGGDPVRLGVVASLNQPGGNITGVTILSGSLTAKRLELLRELVPGPRVVGFLVNPASPEAETQLTDARAAARTIGQDIFVVNA